VHAERSGAWSTLSVKRMSPSYVLLSSPFL
jgi:hypothetical protein